MLCTTATNTCNTIRTQTGRDSNSCLSTIESYMTQYEMLFNGSDSPHRRRHTDHCTVFARWRQCASPFSAWFPAHSSSPSRWLRPWTCAVQDDRARVQGHSWNCAVISKLTVLCRRSTWSVFPPLCSDQLSATVGGLAFPRRRTFLS